MKKNASYANFINNSKSDLGSTNNQFSETLKTNCQSSFTNFSELRQNSD